MFSILIIISSWFHCTVSTIEKLNGKAELKFHITMNLTESSHNMSVNISTVLTMEDTPWPKILSITITSVCMVLGLPSNVYATSILLQRKRVAKAFPVIMHMVLLGMFMCGVYCPFSIVRQFLRTSSILCKIEASLWSICEFPLYMSVGMEAFHRYRKMNTVTVNNMMIKSTNLKFDVGAIALSWILAMFFSIYDFRNIDDGYHGCLGFVNPNITSRLSFSALLTAVCVMVYFYGKCIVFLMKKQQETENIWMENIPATLRHQRPNVHSDANTAAPGTTTEIPLAILPSFPTIRSHQEESKTTLSDPEKNTTEVITVTTEKTTSRIDFDQAQSIDESALIDRDRKPSILSTAVSRTDASLPHFLALPGYIPSDGEGEKVQRNRTNSTLSVFLPPEYSTVGENQRGFNGQKSSLANDASDRHNTPLDLFLQKPNSPRNRTNSTSSAISTLSVSCPIINTESPMETPSYGEGARPKLRKEQQTGPQHTIRCDTAISKVLKVSNKFEEKGSGPIACSQNDLKCASRELGERRGINRSKPYSSSKKKKKITKKKRKNRKRNQVESVCHATCRRSSVDSDESYQHQLSASTDAFLPPILKVRTEELRVKGQERGIGQHDQWLNHPDSRRSKDLGIEGNSHVMNPWNNSDGFMENQLKKPYEIRKSPCENGYFFKEETCQSDNYSEAGALETSNATVITMLGGSMDSNYEKTDKVMGNKQRNMAISVAELLTEIDTGKGLLAKDHEYLRSAVPGARHTLPLPEPIRHPSSPLQRRTNRTAVAPPNGTGNLRDTFDQYKKMEFFNFEDANRSLDDMEEVSTCSLDDTKTNAEGSSHISVPSSPKIIMGKLPFQGQDEKYFPLRMPTAAKQTTTPIDRSQLSSVTINEFLNEMSSKRTRFYYQCTFLRDQQRE